MRATDRLYSCFRKAEVLHLSLPNQFLYRTGDFFDRNVRINAMLIEQIDGLHLESLERTFDGFLDMFRLTIQACRSRTRISSTQVEPEFGRDHQLLPERSEGFAHEFFIGEWAVNLSSIKEGYAAFDGSGRRSVISCLSLGGRITLIPIQPSPMATLSDYF